jgi:hypothetical protein
VCFAAWCSTHSRARLWAGRLINGQQRRWSTVLSAWLLLLDGRQRARRCTQITARKTSRGPSLRRSAPRALFTCSALSVMRSTMRGSSRFGAEFRPSYSTVRNGRRALSCRRRCSTGSKRSTIQHAAAARSATSSQPNSNAVIPTQQPPPESHPAGSRSGGRINWTTKRRPLYGYAMCDF